MVTWGVPEPIVALILACWDQSPGNQPSFKTLLQLREIDFFWESSANNWPPYIANVYNAMVEGITPQPSVVLTNESRKKGYSQKSTTNDQQIRPPPHPLAAIIIVE